MKLTLGVFMYLNKDKYEGDFKADKREGDGRYFFNDGHVYEGEWKSDQENGHGVLMINSGN